MIRMSAMRRRPPTALLSLLFLLFTAATAFAATPAELRRSKEPKEIWEAGKRGRAGADARPIIDAALKDAGLPEGVNNNPWRDLIAQYWKLDHLAQGEPRSYTEGKFVPNAWFTHGARHFLDLAILLTDNKQFVKDIFAAQGIPEAGREQAFKDLLIALIGHDSQQVGFASPKEATREKARIEHPFNGAVATALAYLAAPGTNPAGNKRAMMLAMAAAGHSKSAVDFTDVNRTQDVPNRKFTRGANVMFADILAEVNKQMKEKDSGHKDLTFSNAERDLIIGDAKKIGTVLGAMDSLRERGPKAFGSHPTGETMAYRIEGTKAADKVLVVYNTTNNKTVTTLKETDKRGIEHRTYIEYHTVVEQVSFDGRAFTIRINFADPDIATAGRRDQAADIQKDFARSGFDCTVRFKTFEGGWGKEP
jgi:hypothetical protein